MITRVGDRVWHVQTGAPGIVLEVDGTHLVVQFNGVDRGVRIHTTRVMHSDPGFFGVQ